MMASTLLEDLAELESAEDFLDYFAIDYEPTVVQVNRLHILQRYHDYLQQAIEAVPENEIDQRQHYRYWLEQAYRDFLTSDARTEKVFEVFRRQAEPAVRYVPLEQLMKSRG